MLDITVPTESLYRYHQGSSTYTSIGIDLYEKVIACEGYNINYIDRSPHSHIIDTDWLTAIV